MQVDPDAVATALANSLTGWFGEIDTVDLRLDFARWLEGMATEAGEDFNALEWLVKSGMSREEAGFYLSDYEPWDSSLRTGDRASWLEEEETL